MSVQRICAWFFLAVFCASAETNGVRLDVPFVAQPEDGCGAAAIAMLMQYWHREQPSAPNAPSVDELRPLIGRDGIRATEMKRYLDQSGYRTFAVRGQWDDLEQHLRQGRPLLVALRAGGKLHYVVLTGLDTDDADVKNDPAQRKDALQHKQEFLEQWKGAGYWMLLAVPS